MTTAAADVTICIPAYRAEGFVAETLAAVERQSYPGIRALVSVDASNDGTEAVCRGFERRDPRFRVFAQERRLGWVGNINALLERVDTEFFLILPHDDLTDERYVEVLRGEALRAPHLVNVFSDVEAFGRVSDVRSTPTLEGPLLSRVLTVLAEVSGAAPWRGLTRSALLRQGLRMRDNAHEGKGAAFLWILELACRGPCRRVPLPLYGRRIRDDPDAVTQGWSAWPREKRLAAWTENALACLEVLSRAEAPRHERYRMIFALVARTLAQVSRNAPDAARAARAERIFLAVLLGRACGVENLEPDDILRLLKDRTL